MAQLAEQFTRNEQVIGSNPITSSKAAGTRRHIQKSTRKPGAFFCFYNKINFIGRAIVGVLFQPTHTFLGATGTGASAVYIYNLFQPTHPCGVRLTIISIIL